MFEDNDFSSYKHLSVDAVVSNPPYSQKWNSKEHSLDPRYVEYGIAPKSKADYALFASLIFIMFNLTGLWL
nr:N-6 DNA methylase [Mycoplasmopsis bovis]